MSDSGNEQFNKNFKEILNIIMKHEKKERFIQILINDQPGTMHEDDDQPDIDMIYEIISNYVPDDKDEIEKMYGFISGKFTTMWGMRQDVQTSAQKISSEREQVPTERLDTDGEQYEEANPEMGIADEYTGYVLSDDFQQKRHKDQVAYFVEKMRTDGCDSIDELLLEARKNASENPKWQSVQNAIERAKREAECGSGSIFERHEEANPEMGIADENTGYVLSDEFQKQDNKEQAAYFVEKMRTDGCDSIDELLLEARKNASENPKWQSVQNAIERAKREAECGSGSIFEQHEEGNVHQGVKPDDKRCSAIGFKHNKRMHYLRLEKTDEEIQKMSKQEQKDLLNNVKKKIKDAIQNGTVGDIAFTKLKDFEKNFGVKPSAEDFNAIDDELDKKCNNIIDLHPFLPENPAEMGGHPGAFVNIYVEKGDGTCDIWGGKKWIDDSVTEYEFYQYLYKKENPGVLFKNFKKYIAEFQPDSKCKPSNPMMDKDKEMNFYIPMSNAKNEVRKGDEKIHYFDFKLGYKTAFLHEKGKKGIEDTSKRDQHQSVSNKIGFRAEGSTLVDQINNISPEFQKESGWHKTTKEGLLGGIIDPQKKYPVPERVKIQKPDQYKLYLLNPGYIYDVLFYNTPDQHIIDFCEKLKIFEKEFIEENFKAFHGESQHAIAFIGCSLLLVSGGGGISFKLIDFAHPYVLASKSIDTAVKIEGNTVKKRVLVDDDESCCAVNNYTKDHDLIKYKGSSYSNKLAVEPDYDKHAAKKKMKNIKTNASFDWKINIDYHRWRHTFENFMGGIIAFVYSFHFWANSRLNYKLKKTRETKHEQLIKEFNSYNKHFGKEMTEPTSDKGKKQYDPPYPWAIEHKNEKLQILIEKSLSNLSRIPN